MLSGLDDTSQRTVIVCILLLVNVIGGTIGGLGIGFIAALSTTGHQVMGVVFSFVCIIILFSSVFVVFIQHEREKRRTDEFQI